MIAAASGTGFSGLLGRDRREAEARIERECLEVERRRRLGAVAARSAMRGMVVLRMPFVATSGASKFDAVQRAARRLRRDDGRKPRLVHQVVVGDGPRETAPQTADRGLLEPAIGKAQAAAAARARDDLRKRFAGAGELEAPCELAGEAPSRDERLQIDAVGRQMQGRTREAPVPLDAPFAIELASRQFGAGRGECEAALVELEAQPPSRPANPPPRSTNGERGDAIPAAWAADKAESASPPMGLARPERSGRAPGPRAPGTERAGARIAPVRRASPAKADIELTARGSFPGTARSSARARGRRRKASSPPKPRGADRRRDAGRSREPAEPRRGSVLPR